MSPNDNWCTPEWLTNLLPEVDLDPCSNPNSTVRAKRALSLENGDDGLTDPWDAPESGVASVYINPPYSRGEVDKWARKAVHFIQAAPTSRALLALVKLDPTTDWWARFHGVPCRAYVFKDRIKFDGADTGAPFCSALLVLTGDDKFELPTKLKRHFAGCLTPYPWLEVD
jgi:hypothetical protein